MMEIKQYIFTFLSPCSQLKDKLERKSKMINSEINNNNNNKKEALETLTNIFWKLNTYLQPSKASLVVRDKFSWKSSNLLRAHLWQILAYIKFGLLRGNEMGFWNP